MVAPQRTPAMTRDEFLQWVEAQEERYEFDGFEPVLMDSPAGMAGGTAAHDKICQNIYFALRSRLRPGGCDVMGPNAGVATEHDAIRYPDALVSCAPTRDTDRLVSGVVIVFEVISPTSARVDRIEKVREYRAVPTILRYVLVETSTAALTVLSRAGGNDEWTARPLTTDDHLVLPEIDVSVPVAELYARTDLLAA